MTLKAYRVLNKHTKKIEESCNITFDDHFVKASCEEPIPRGAIFPEDQVDSEPLTTFEDDFYLFFNKPETAINSESKAPDNKGDELLKLIDETAESIGVLT